MLLMQTLVRLRRLVGINSTLLLHNDAFNHNAEATRKPPPEARTQHNAFALSGSVVEVTNQQCMSLCLSTSPESAEECWVCALERFGG